MLADEFFKKAHDHCKFAGKYYQLRRDEKDGEPGNPQACDAWISYFHHKGWDKVARWAKNHLNNGGCVTVPEIMPQRFDYECPEFDWNPENPRHVDMSRIIKKTARGSRPLPPKARANIAEMADVAAALGYDGKPVKREMTQDERIAWLEREAANPHAPKLSRVGLRSLGVHSEREAAE